MQAFQLLAYFNFVFLVVLMKTGLCRIALKLTRLWSKELQWKNAKYTEFVVSVCLFFFFNSCLTADPPAGSWLEVQYTRELTYVQHTENNLSCEEYDSQMWHKCVPVVLFLVDRGTNNFFFRLRSDVFYSESLFQTNHLVHLNTSRQGIFLVWRHDFFVLVLRDVHLQHVYLQEESLTGVFLCKTTAANLSDHILSSADKQVKQRSCWQFYGRQKPS